ncbi:hypothetical protein [Nocardiopsis sp. FIRDI 009]|uniref:hypothetical protein n=1 Tax=Nocardiopsis sp. FIRDI 009 TaxID=714197 RepID=UPI000E23E4DC|nr:hypothetical protein [Nocardiopsis sp. FIRDI 009]
MQIAVGHPRPVDHRERLGHAHGEQPDMLLVEGSPDGGVVAEVVAVRVGAHAPGRVGCQVHGDHGLDAGRVDTAQQARPLLDRLAPPRGQGPALSEVARDVPGAAVVGDPELHETGCRVDRTAAYPKTAERLRVLASPTR